MLEGLRQIRFEPTQRNEVRLVRTSSLAGDPSTYRLARLFPRLRRPDRAWKDGPLMNSPKDSLKTLAHEIFDDAETMGLEMGRKNPAVKVFRVSGIDWAGEGEPTDLSPERVLMKIDDGKGNRVTFHMSYMKGYVDGEQRPWDRIVTRMESATLDGKRVKLTPEMKRDGFVFLSNDMPEILASQQGDQPRTVYTRQETPDAICFVDGHTGSVGRHDLGCTCREERRESLQIIHKEGGVNCLMPGTGNGNGSEAQDRQMMARSSAVRRGREDRDHRDVYRRMGKVSDGRDDALAISTLLMEHLFRMGEVNSITVLSDNPRKVNTWAREGRTVAQQPLASAKRDHADYAAKSAAGYAPAIS